MASGGSCYYPNGKSADPAEKPCGNGDGVACCPDSWECQPNGLCYLSAQDYTTRFSCTDKSWKSDGCPQFCTRGNTAIGADALAECDPNSWCCDANRPELSGGQVCCDTTKDRFGLSDSVKAEVRDNSGSSGSGSSSSDSDSDSDSSATTSSDSSDDSSTDTDTGAAATSGDDSATSFFGGPAAASSSKQNAHTTTPATTSKHLITSVSSNSGTVSTIVITSQVTAQAASTSAPAPSSHKNLAPIIAPAVIVPVLVLALAGLAAFFLLRRRRRRRYQEPEIRVNGGPSQHDAVPMYKKEVSPLSPYSNTTASELEGSSPNVAGWGKGSKSPEARFETPEDVRASMLSRSSAGTGPGGGAASSNEGGFVPPPAIREDPRHNSVELPADEVKGIIHIGNGTGLGIHGNGSGEKGASELGDK